MSRRRWAALGVSQRLACTVPGQHRCTQRKARRTADDEAPPTQAIVARATQYRRPGHRRITALLQAEGWACKHRRVERIWRTEVVKVSARTLVWHSTGLASVTLASLAQAQPAVAG